MVDNCININIVTFNTKQSRPLLEKLIFPFLMKSLSTLPLTITKAEEFLYLCESCTPTKSSVW